MIKKHTGHWIYSEYDHIKKIDENDKKLKVDRDRKVNIPPFHYLSVIKMNSTYLELSNRPYTFYGLYTLIWILLFISLYLGLSLYFIYSTIDSIFDDTFSFFMLFIFLLYIVVVGFIFYRYLFKYLKKNELNQYYYLPIRLNRINRKLYVYTKSGEVKPYKWDDLFFYMATVDWLYGIKKMELRAAKVDEDDNIEFSFSLGGPMPYAEDIKQAMSYWEFLRQYMEEGTKNFYINKDSLDKFDQSKLTFCNDIDQKLEGYETSKLRIFYNYKPLGMVDMLLVAPIYYPWLWVRRYLIKHSAKVPYWPEEVERECQIVANDPYVVGPEINQYFEIKNFPSRIELKKEYKKQKA